MTLPINYDNASQQERRLAREAYIRKQNGLCWYCLAPLSGPAADPILEMPIKKHLFPSTMFKYPVHLHHDHDTGMTRGAVHSVCNAVLWQYYGE